ncbi:MAG TPA: nuclear transport factor 2 family protein [Hyphomicrobiaceae bacterium]|nr:nuclear transport factor 2 family protein [Hyphomicrobiaceae bacterium]
MSSREVVEAFFAYWGVQDVEMASALFHEGIVYKLHVASADLPFGGVWRGREACRDTMFSILREFDYLRYEPNIVSVRGGVVRAQIRFAYQHRRTGGILEGTRRLVFRVKGDRIMRIDGYHDAQLVEAFMRLTKSRLASDQLVRPPVLPTRETQGSSN